MTIKNIIVWSGIVAGVVAFTASSAAMAQTIKGPLQIIGAKTNIKGGNKIYALPQIWDGIYSDTSPFFNGFQGAQNTIGKITFTLNGAYDLTAFYLWNDINVRAEGVDTYSLFFYRSNGFANILVGSKLNIVAKFGQTSAQKIKFPKMIEISTVVMQIMSVQNRSNTVYQGVEIREVAFDGVWNCGGTPTTC